MKQKQQPANIKSGRLCINSPGLVGGFRTRRDAAPWARSGSISPAAMLRNANTAGISKQTVTMKTAAR